MGERKIKDKAIRPLALTSITPEDVESVATVPIGNYKGNAAWFDLDKLANQPLVQAEMLHIEGILDGREEDYDLQSLSTVLGEAAGTSHSAPLTVPAGKAWWISCIAVTLPASGGANIIEGNWFVSSWVDRVGSLGHGQPFHNAFFNFGVGGGIQYDEFGPVTPLWALGNKASMLRLPAGTVITFVINNTTAAAAGAVTATLQVYGFTTTMLVN